MDNPSPGSQLKSSITDASLKIEGIIDDAERAAAEIRAEARKEAEVESRRLISESASQLAAVAEPLTKRVENLRVEAAALMHELEAATLQLVELTQRTSQSAGAEASPQIDSQPTVDAPSPAAEPIASTPSAEKPKFSEPPNGPKPIAYPGREAGEPTSDQGPPEEAVLRATQMAVAGSSRTEIEAELRKEFELEDAGPVVDDILGPA